LFDAVDDLRVACAAAQMRLERAGDFVAGNFFAVAAEADAAHRHAGDAEATLHAAAADERFRNLLAVLLVEPFQPGDRCAFGFPGFERAREHGLAVYQHRAAAALGLRLAAIFRRGDAELVAKHVEQREPGFIKRNLDILAVDAAREGAAGARSGFGSN